MTKIVNPAMNERLKGHHACLVQVMVCGLRSVRAKADGRRSSTGTAFMHLFPDRFQESSIGEIPAGWRMLGLWR